ncbi:MAG: hypothetical protein IJU62_08765 [Muribaculaceae bacterium]|nr:hypothetical protein [Muribaculaceae bacterium]
MVRIVADTGTGGWWHCSAQDKGKSYTNWPNCMNQFDGFTYWADIAGRDKVILDGAGVVWHHEQWRRGGGHVQPQ